jgi:apolipoprotein N-acyltransferase
MLRATNTGASAAIDERGRVVARLPPFTAGTLLAAAVPHEGLTPYARLGNAPVLALVLAAMALAGRRVRPRGSEAGTAPRTAPPAPRA